MRSERQKGFRWRNAPGTDFREYVRTSRKVLDVVIEKELRNALGSVTGSDGALLFSILNEGKKIRGCFTCAVGGVLGATLDAVVPRAVAVEMIQAATLVHDDYVDQDRTRRNKPALWTLEGARRAVLMGDVIFATAVKMMSDLGRQDGSCAARAIALVSKGALREPLDPFCLAALVEEDRVDGDLYEEITRLKTGVLFGIACELGAIAAGAEVRVREGMYDYGVYTGEAYQMADDLKEVEAYLANRRLGPDRMAPLVPALLRFAPHMRPHVVELLRGERTALDDDGAGWIEAVKKAMEQGIEGRLRCAESGIRAILAPGTAAALLFSAPRATIDMFNAA